MQPLYYSSVVRYTTGTVYYVMASSKRGRVLTHSQSAGFQDQVLGCPAAIVGHSAYAGRLF